MKKLIIIFAALLVSYQIDAKEKAASEKPSGTSGNIAQRVLSNCSAPKASKELWLNNVRLKPNTLANDDEQYPKHLYGIRNVISVDYHCVS